VDLAEARSAADSIGSGVVFEQEVSGSDDGLDTSATEACRVFVSVVAVSVFLLVGSWALSSFELDAENQAVVGAVEEMLAFKEKYNVTDEDFQALVDTAGTPVEFSEDGKWVASSHRNWNLQSDLILFAWTILSTIGYGNFAPSTVHAHSSRSCLNSVPHTSHTCPRWQSMLWSPSLPPSATLSAHPTLYLNVAWHDTSRAGRRQDFSNDVGFGRHPSRALCHWISLRAAHEDHRVRNGKENGCAP
jgi:hypothetical protein